jgi:hypothetical protein
MGPASGLSSSLTPLPSLPTRLSPRHQAVAEFETIQRDSRVATSVGGVLTGRAADITGVPTINEEIYEYYRRRAEALRQDKAKLGPSVRLHAPAGVGAVQLLSGIRRTVSADGTVEMSEPDAAPLLQAGWARPFARAASPLVPSCHPDEGRDLCPHGTPAKSRLRPTEMLGRSPER